MREGRYNATLNQCGLYAVQALGGHFATSTNICFQVEFEGALDVAAFRRAFGRIARAHDAFRTSFHREDRNLIAHVHAAVELPCREHDLRGQPRAEIDAALARLARADASEPFDLTVAPLARLQIVWTGEAEGVALFAFHHIVVDGASVATFWKDLCDAYDDVCRGVPDTREPPSDQMSAFAEAEVELRRARGLDPGLAQWRERLQGPLTFPTVTLGRAVPALHAPFGIGCAVEVPAHLVLGVRALARRHRTTPFVVGLAAVKALVARVTGVDDGIVFATFANRKTMRGGIGYLVNTLPLRDVLGAGDGFEAFLARVSETVRLARDASHVPFSLLARELMADSSPPFPLLNVIVDSPPAEYAEIARVERSGVRMRLGTVLSPIAAHLSVGITTRGDGIGISFRYAGTEEDATALQGLARGLIALLEAAIGDPAAPLASIDLAAGDEARDLLRLGAGDRLVEPATMLSTRLRDTAARSPDALALVGGGERLTYRDLERRVAACASLLSKATPDRFVLVATTGMPAVLAVLAAVQLGVPWICVDPTQGRARLARAFELCRPAVVVVGDDDGAAFAGSAPTLVTASQLGKATRSGTGTPRAVDADDLAYAVLTSGTTGDPKLVGIDHGALAAQLAALLQAGMFGARPTMALLAPLTFDASLEQLFLPLVTGGTVVVPDRATLADPSALWDLIARERVTVLDTIPSLARALLPSAPDVPTLERLILGGEPLPIDLVRDVGARLPGRRVFDTYGPTEATINATFAEADGERAAIGRPLPGTHAFIVDRELRLLPRGLVGQLALAGPCLARGYLGDADATGRSFVPASFLAGERIYLTGDRARWGDDGRIVSLGRADGQVKIRGVRVDLHEVERALARCAGIEESIAVRHETNQRARLAVAYVAAGDTPGRRELRARLAAELPRGMVPDILLPLRALPRTPNGKVDRAALAVAFAEHAPAPSSTAIRISPHERETTICECMRLALALDVAPAPGDDFFDLGGDSLALISLLAHLAARGLLLTADDVRDAPTARALVRRCRVTTAAHDQPPSLDEAHRALDANAAALAAPPRRVLLTGATGLFGVHLLDELLQRTSVEILCLVRAESDARAQARLAEAWRRAHGDRALPLERVRALRGDVATVGLGLTAEGAAALERVDTVIHAAAHVGWFAPRELLDATNVEGTRNVVAFTKALGARLHYVSTASVAFASARALPYVASKVRAERVVLEGGVPARIWRVGLLAGRLRDGAFPLVDPDDNGLLLLLATILDPAARAHPEIARAFEGGASIELSPVDVCAARMVELLSGPPDLEPILVLKHDGPVELARLGHLAGELSVRVARRLPENVLAAILATTIDAAADPCHDATRLELAKRGLEWPAADDAYVRRFLARS